MIPVAFISDENFIMQTAVAITSLAKSKLDTTEYKVYVIAAECSESAEAKLKNLETLFNGIQVEIKRTGLEMYRDIKQVAHIPISCLLKFDLCDIISEEDKIIYLDGDIVVRKDLSDFYAIDLGDNYLAGVPSLDLVFSEETKLVNAGILLFDAKKMRDNNMRDILVEKRRSLGDSGSMDQKTFNLVMKDQIGYLPYEYNCIPGKIMGAERGTYTIEKLNALYNTSFESSKDLVENAAIWHYATGDKPWKYSFIYGADEWYENYLASPYGAEKLDRKSAFRAHAEGVINHLKNGGVKSVVNRLVDYIKTLTGKAENKTWG